MPIDPGFHNFLSVSPSIVAPSQYYQVKEDIRAEGFLSLVNGTLHYKDQRVSRDVDLAGHEESASGFVNLGGGLLVGVETLFENRDYKDTEKHYNTTITPSLTYSILPNLSLGFAEEFSHQVVNAEGGKSSKGQYHSFNFGVTAHEGNWEATAYGETENKDEDTPQNEHPGIYGVHGRYRFAQELVGGLSYQQSTYSDLHDPLFDLKDESRIGLHVESVTSESFALEIDYFNFQNQAGVSGQRANLFSLGAQALVSVNIEAGARLDIFSVDSKAIEYTQTSPKVFIGLRF